MIDCCELALANSRLALYIALGAFSTIALLLAMFFGYNLTLGARTTKLEKKNGHELEQIKKIDEKVSQMEQKLKNHEQVSNLPKAKTPT